jgi:hypothetical protein
MQCAVEAMRKSPTTLIGTSCARMSDSSEHYLSGWSHGKRLGAVERGTFALNYVLYPKYDIKRWTQMDLCLAHQKVELPQPLKKERRRCCCATCCLCRQFVSIAHASLTITMLHDTGKCTLLKNERERNTV